ncbi:unnamed protein product [Linum tenue]|uniref:S-protein homolog n=1 Tax=Linum tenue TaxID=586396 RepID=A0AAV0R9E5_9ROSI|nr:unnamed protein product [Linum tenue]
MTIVRQNRVISAAVVLILLSALMAAATAAESKRTIATTQRWHWPWGPRTRVTITNRISGWRQLKVHCKSGNDDLGVQVLNPGEGYRFKFWPNVQGTTLFYCYFNWGEGLRRFDIYDQDRDSKRCKTWCPWDIKESGPCVITKDFTSCFQWKK